MKREEVGAAAFGFALACAMFLIIALAGASLSGSAFFNSGANVIQWTSGPGLIAALAMGAWARWHSRCATRFCIRRGEHPVDGTVKRVCVHHHTREHHRLVYSLHAVDHPWGFSHLKAKPPPHSTAPRGRRRGL